MARGDANDEPPAGEDAAPAVGRQVVEKGLEPAVLIRMEGQIDSFLEQALFRRLDVAKSQGAKLVIIEIDSPGGYVYESLNIATKLRDLSWARTVAYVPREAISGAAFVALGCDEIVMDEKAMIGDAGPIVLGEDSQFRHAEEKLVSYIAAQVGELAAAKNRPRAIAEAMVNRKLEVFEVTKGQEHTFMSDAEIKAAGVGAWVKGPLVAETGKGLFLEVSGKRAIELDLASANVPDRAALYKYLGLTQPPTVMEYAWTDTLALILNLWPVTILLFIIGLTCLYIELHIPGIGVAGILSAMCFVLFFWSRFLGGTANWFEVVLFIGGVACILLEIFVTTGTMVAGFTGGLLVLASVVMAGQRSFDLNSPRNITLLLWNLSSLAAAGGGFALVAMTMSRYFHRVPMMNRLMLVPPAANAQEESEPSRSPQVAAIQIRDELLGQRGVAKSTLRPSGKAKFGDRVIEVVADGDVIPPGRTIEVVEVIGNRIMVVEAEDQPS